MNPQRDDSAELVSVEIERLKRVRKQLHDHAELAAVGVCQLEYNEGKDMPRVSGFFGITISMYHNDHSPPHFHARYAGSEASFTIDTLEQVEGELHRRARAMVVEWASLHRNELLENWDRAREGLPLEEIDPLD